MSQLPYLCQIQTLQLGFSLSHVQPLSISGHLLRVAPHPQTVKPEGVKVKGPSSSACCARDCI
eukprot:NODE_2450_length_923_cov_38.820366_g2016_i0.p2 GENE.NODE_2450_length_923_cov_38.820366_g2016_i0~~NODE_2450_length_923_cov_38.820366_g2016_i0.p2  ORF type:complete len:63 (+),score=4.94 NODE_2450_length_923_cov_38.820366_g2016_i0:283-471(+)